MLEVVAYRDHSDAQRFEVMDEGNAGFVGKLHSAPKDYGGRYSKSKQFDLELSIAGGEKVAVSFAPPAHVNSFDGYWCWCGGGSSKMQLKRFNLVLRVPSEHGWKRCPALQSVFTEIPRSSWIRSPSRLFCGASGATKITIKTEHNTMLMRRVAKSGSHFTVCWHAGSMSYSSRRVQWE